MKKRFANLIDRYDVPVNWYNRIVRIWEEGESGEKVEAAFKRITGIPLLTEPLFKVGVGDPDSHIVVKIYKGGWVKTMGVENSVGCVI